MIATLIADIKLKFAWASGFLMLLSVFAVSPMEAIHPLFGVPIGLVLLLFVLAKYIRGGDDVHVPHQDKNSSGNPIKMGLSPSSRKLEEEEWKLPKAERATKNRRKFYKRK